MNCGSKDIFKNVPCQKCTNAHRTNTNTQMLQEKLVISYLETLEIKGESQKKN